MADDDKPKKLGIMPLFTCEKHGTTALVRDEDGNVGINRLVEAGPDNPANAQFTGERNGPWMEVQVTHRGPAKVNSAAYRQGWERIFGNNTPVGEA